MEKTTKVIFFHGGGSREDYEADQKLVTSLISHLGQDFAVHYPYLPNDGTPDLGRRAQINKEITSAADGMVLVAHSLGASMLLACLSETEIKKEIRGIFLLATPFWDGDEDWVDAFRLQPDFAKKIDPEIPLFFYHCRDDEEVPFEQLSIYQQNLPRATFRELATGGHQFNNELSRVAKDIRSLTT